MSKYFPIDFEEKWANKWIEKGLFQNTFDHPSSPKASEGHGDKMYLLYAFAYPSGSGLHVGHVEPLTALDILARYYRSIGKKVFFPVGWDAFGLPAENYAIKTGIPPVKTTKDAIDTFSRQIKRIGVSYDWEAEIATCHPGYYKWTQWLFLQLYKKKLAYKKSAPVNWCPSCQTVLANEQVVEGTCERCSTEVIQKNMEQWFFKITQYMDELISGLDAVDWPKATKQQQLNWIGKSEGAEITFQISNSETLIPVFTTAHDTIYGATFLVLAPEHFIALSSNNKEVQQYIKQAKAKTEEERLINKEKTGVFSGLYALNPATQKEIPIWISDYVLVQYGTGAIMAVPGSDERDYQFAKKFDLPIKYIAGENGTSSDHKEFISFTKEIKERPSQYVLTNSGEFDGQNFKDGREGIMKKLESLGVAKRATTYKLRDWLISRQRYWGAPIPIVYDPEGTAHMVKEKHLPWMLPTDVDFKPTGESPLKLSKEFNERVEKLYGKGWTPEYDTMDTFVDSSWYYLRFTDPRNTVEFARTEQMKKWMPVDFYMIGPEHIVLHLLYSRFFTKFLRDEGYLSVDEPFTKMRHQGMILGPDHRKMSKSKGNVINPDDVITEYGADTLRMYEMFMGPIDADKPWSVESVQGQYRFLKRVWNFFGVLESRSNLDTKESSKEITQLLNKTIKKVGEDIEAFKFNTAIAAMMEFLNEVDDNISLKDAKVFLKILSPFAPFMTEEIWRSQLGGKESIHTVSWPKVDESALQKSTVTIPIQVNGKLRGSIDISVDDSQEQVIQKALTIQKVQQYVADNSYKKAMYVPGKILNFIV